MHAEPQDRIASGSERELLFYTRQIRTGVLELVLRESSFLLTRVESRSFIPVLFLAVYVVRQHARFGELQITLKVRPSRPR